MSLKRSICSDTSTEKRGSDFIRHVIGNLECKAIVSSPLVGISTKCLVVGGSPVIIISEYHLTLAKILTALLAVITFLAATTLSTYTNTITDLDVFDILSNFSHNTDNLVKKDSSVISIHLLLQLLSLFSILYLVSNNTWIISGTPTTVKSMNIRSTDTTVCNIHLNVIVFKGFKLEFTPFKGLVYIKGKTCQQ